MTGPQSARAAAFRLSRPASDNRAMTAVTEAAWWRRRRDALLACLGTRDSAYVYDLATVRQQVAAFRALRSVSQVLYALKANPHPEILRAVHATGCGFECVSRAEVERVLAEVPGVAPEQLAVHAEFRPARRVRVGPGTRAARHRRQPFDPARLAGALRRTRDLPAAGCVERPRSPRESPHRRPALEVWRAARRVRRPGRRGRRGGRTRRRTSRAWRQREFRPRRRGSGPARILAAEAARHPGARILNLGGGIGVPERAGSARPSTCARSMPRLRASGVAPRRSNCGWSPGATSWRQPAYCLRA